MAHSPRGWTGARTPSAIKRVRQTERRRLINQPRRTAAKTLISKALLASSNGQSAEEVQEAVARAVSALDRAAKGGVIHANAAARRKSRLMLKVNAAIGGEEQVAAAKTSRTTGKAAAAKQARARIAAGRATKAKGAQTAAGKARAALARSTRETSGPDVGIEDAAPAAAAKAPRTQATKTASSAAKPAAKSRASSRTSASESAAKPAAKRSTKASTKAPTKKA